MRIKFAIVFAIFAMASLSSMGQEWTRVNDSTWMRNPSEYRDKFGNIITASKVDKDLLLASINNDLNSASILAGGSVFVSLATVLAVVIEKDYDISMKIATVGGIASATLGVMAIFTLYRDRVYLTPEGVIVKINKAKVPIK